MTGLAPAILACESGPVTAAVPRADVLGPLHGSIWIPEIQGTTRAKAAQLARQLVDEVKATGHLPANLGPPLGRVGVNHLYLAFAEPLWIANLKMVQGDDMDPDLDVNSIFRDTRLQTWTLKPAIVPV